MKAFLKKLVGYPEFEQPATAVGAMKAHPVVVNGSDHERAKIHAYRIDAIERYIAQKSERGAAIPAEKLADLHGELAVRRAKLAKLKKGAQ